MSGSTIRKYPLALWFNGRRYTEVAIDPHYQAKHSESVTDDLILELRRNIAETGWRAERDGAGLTEIVCGNGGHILLQGLS